MANWRLIFGTTLLVTLICAFAPTEHLDAYSGCGGVNAPVVNADYEQQVLDLVNTERANQSLPPLKRVTGLDNAARYHATDMGQDDYFDHNSFDRSGGMLTQVCDTWSRIATYYSGAMAENIAAGYGTPANVMVEWMNSPGHRANILSTSVWEIGVGYYAGSGYYGDYWVQNFGRRINVYPLIINRDAASTNSTLVSIYIYGTWNEMRLRNDSGAWGSWQPFQNSFSWTLAAIGGTRTVNAEVRNSSTTIPTSDTILLTSFPPVTYRLFLPVLIK